MNLIYQRMIIRCIGTAREFLVQLGENCYNSPFATRFNRRVKPTVGIRVAVDVHFVNLLLEEDVLLHRCDKLRFVHCDGASSGKDHVTELNNSALLRCFVVRKFDSSNGGSINCRLMK